MASKPRSHLDLLQDEQKRYNSELEEIHNLFQRNVISATERNQRIDNLQKKYSLPHVIRSEQPTKTRPPTKNYHSAVYGEALGPEVIAGENIYQELNKVYSLSGSPHISFIKDINKGFSFEHDERKHKYPGNTLPYNGILMQINVMHSKIEGQPWDGFNTSCVSILPENATENDIYGAFKEIKEIVKIPNPNKAKLTIGVPLRDGTIPNDGIFINFFNEDNKKYPVVPLDELKKNNIYGERGNEKGIFPIPSMNMAGETAYLLKSPEIKTIEWDLINDEREIHAYSGITFVYPARKLPEEKVSKQKSFFEKKFSEYKVLTN